METTAKIMRLLIASAQVDRLLAFRGLVHPGFVHVVHAQPPAAGALDPFLGTGFPTRAFFDGPGSGNSFWTPKMANNKCSVICSSPEVWRGWRLLDGPGGSQRSWEDS